MISKFNQIFIIGLFPFICNINAQVGDYRDSFLGLYHTATPPCVPGNSSPNHYILIEKDTNSTTDIFANDTMWGEVTYLYRHPCTLNQSDSTYEDGYQLGKFVRTDSLRISTGACGFGAMYYLRKIAPIGIYNMANKHKEWYMFPNPAVNELNIVLPSLSEELRNVRYEW